MPDTSQAPGYRIASTDEVVREMWEYIKSREWWVIPWISESAQSISTQVEARYYSGAANGDFRLMTQPLESGAVACAFARKRRMSPTQLLDLMHSQQPSPLTPDDLQKRDVILATDPDSFESEAQTHARVAIWHRWLLSTRTAA